MSNSIHVDVDGETVERDGVMYAEEAYHVGQEVTGVAVQYEQQPHDEEPDTEFIVGGELQAFYSCEVIEQLEKPNLEQIESESGDA